jgi:hypothetical protein
MGGYPLSKLLNKQCKRKSGCLIACVVLSCLSLLGQAMLSRTSDFLVPKDTTASSTHKYTSTDQAGNRIHNFDERSTESAAVNTSTEAQADNSSNCTLKKQASWNVYTFGNNSTTSPASKKLLVAQYSSDGSYARLLELTEPINKAYARKWNHDMLVLQGTALSLKTDGPCEPPEQRSMYNKIPILIFALTKKAEYDQLLILDADTLIYNLNFDVTDLIEDHDMLAAHRVSDLDGQRTWNINNGVTLWNLKHNLTKKVARQWLKRTVDGLNGAKEHGWSEHGDQHYLHRSLMKEKGAVNHIRALSDEFRYANATVVKHFVRPKNGIWSDYGMDRREEKIKAAVKEIRENYTSDCQGLEEIAYTTL